MYGRKWKDTGSSGSSSSACYDSQHMGSSVSSKSTVSSPRRRNSFQILCSQVLLGAVGGPLPRGMQIFYGWWLGIQPWGTGQGCRTLPAHPAIQQKGHASTAILLSGWNSLCAIHAPMYRCQKSATSFDISDPDWIKCWVTLYWTRYDNTQILPCLDGW